MGVPHVAGFVTICEAFLGMEPHMDIFGRLFYGRALTAGNLVEIAPVGGVRPVEETEHGRLVSRIHAL